MTNNNELNNPDPHRSHQDVAIQSKNGQKREWYKKWWGVILAIIFWPYFIIYFAWVKSKWPMFLKIISTVVCAFFGFIFLISFVIAIVNPPEPNTKTTVTKTVQNKDNNTNETTQPKEAQNNANPQQQPTPNKIAIKELGKWYKGIEGSIHYQYMESGKPEQSVIQNVMKDIVAKGCGYQVCNYYLWDSEDNYNKRKTGDTATEIAETNKEHLIGYINTGNMFFYYGKSGDDKNYIIYDPTTKTFMDFSRN